MVAKLFNKLTSENETVSIKDLHLYHSEQVTDELPDEEKDCPLILEQHLSLKCIPEDAHPSPHPNIINSAINSS